jgi:hypothetical protein
MPDPKFSLKAAQTKARAALAAITDEHDKSVTEAALTDPDAQPLDDDRLARMRVVMEVRGGGA